MISRLHQLEHALTLLFREAHIAVAISKSPIELQLSEKSNTGHINKFENFCES